MNLCNLRLCHQDIILGALLSLIRILLIRYFMLRGRLLLCRLLSLLQQEQLLWPVATAASAVVLVVAAVSLLLRPQLAHPLAAGVDRRIIILLLHILILSFVVDRQLFLQVVVLGVLVVVVLGVLVVVVVVFHSPPGRILLPLAQDRLIIARALPPRQQQIIIITRAIASSQPDPRRMQKCKKVTSHAITIIITMITYRTVSFVT
jgi:hypothetical protein